MEFVGAGPGQLVQCLGTRGPMTSPIEEGLSAQSETAVKSFLTNFAAGANCPFAEED